MCMDFLVNPAGDTEGTVMSGRTVEYGQDMKTIGIIRRAGSSFHTPAPDYLTTKKLNGARWISLYSYIGTATRNTHISPMMTALALGKNFVLQGMNTEGLSCGALYLSESEYSTVAKDDYGKALHYFCFSDWVLGNCASVQDVLEQLQQQQVVVWGDIDSADSFAVHYSLFDKTGAAIVVEWTGGKINIYNNPLRVCTNRPTFDWHLRNVQNYLNLSTDWPSDLSINNLFSQSATTENTADPDLPILKTIPVGTPTGSGYGMCGIPGDASPPSRLIRMFFLKNSATQAADATELRNQVLHLINSTDIIKGDNWSKKTEDCDPTTDYTQLSMILDYTHLTVYFRTYDNPQLRKISLQTALDANPDVYEMTVDYDEKSPDDAVDDDQIFTVCATPVTDASSSGSLSHAAE